MTPEERAAEVIGGPGPLADEYRRLISAAIRDAILEEREACAKRLDADGKTVWQDAPQNSYAGGYRRACENNAAAIRARADA